MDFQELLSRADYNSETNKYTGTGTKYSCVLPPPKKVPKANVQSENIKKFLEKKRLEEEAKVAEARRQKEKLLALRAQSTKNNKKAKIMASRTKDNDFSRIKLTDDEVEAKKKREAELIKKNLADKVERMKARIEMEEREKLLPRKRKRKSKNAEPTESLEDNHDDLQNDPKELSSNIIRSNSSIPPKVHKPRPPPPPAMNFTDLLKIAEKKQFEPLEITVKKKEEEKLMTKKERKLREEELARERRKQERLQERLLAENGRIPKSKPVSVQSSSINKKAISEKIESKKPVVIHVAKDVHKKEQDAAKFKVPKSTVPPPNKNNTIKPKDNYSSFNSKHCSNSVSAEKSSKSSVMNGQKKIGKLREENSSSLKSAEIRQKDALPKKNGLKINPVNTAPVKTEKVDKEALKAALEKEIREKLEKEMEEKIAATFAKFQNLQAMKASEKTPEVPKQVKKEPEVTNKAEKKVTGKPVVHSKKDIERLIAMKKQAAQQKMKPKVPEKKPFHFNPYLDPPRRLLEPQRPPRPVMKRRIESDEEDDDDDDDMDDFIDDTPSQNEENYSEYIKEIFKYDKSKYLDDDEDEVMESSFAQQMQEEVRSARLGYLEDLEEERLETERKKRKKIKK